MRKIRTAFVLALGLSAAQALFAETIAEIQGEWHTSPCNGKTVSGVEGVVTAVYGTKYNTGFYMQSVKADILRHRKEFGLNAKTAAGLPSAT